MRFIRLETDNKKLECNWDEDKHMGICQFESFTRENLGFEEDNNDSISQKNVDKTLFRKIIDRLSNEEEWTKSWR